MKKSLDPQTGLPSKMLINKEMWKRRDSSEHGSYHSQGTPGSQNHKSSFAAKMKAIKMANISKHLTNLNELKQIKVMLEKGSRVSTASQDGPREPLSHLKKEIVSSAMISGRKPTKKAAAKKLKLKLPISKPKISKKKLTLA